MNKQKFAKMEHRMIPKCENETLPLDRNGMHISGNGHPDPDSTPPGHII